MGGLHPRFIRNIRDVYYHLLRFSSKSRTETFRDNHHVNNSPWLTLSDAESHYTQQVLLVKIIKSCRDRMRETERTREHLIASNRQLAVHAGGLSKGGTNNANHVEPAISVARTREYLKDFFVPSEIEAQSSSSCCAIPRRVAFIPTRGVTA